jgi:hypothetical protein
MNTTTVPGRREREHICTYPDLEAFLRSLGVACIAYRYLDADLGGSVSEIDYFDMHGNSAAARISPDLRSSVQASIERDALQSFHRRWADREEQRVRWRL